MIERRDHARLLVSWVSLACSLFFRSLALPISLLQVSFSSSLFFPSLLHLLAFAIVSLLASFPPSLVPFFPLILFLYLSIYHFFYLSICLFPSSFSLPFPPVPHSSGSRSPTKRHFSHTEAHLIGLDPPPRPTPTGDELLPASSLSSWPSFSSSSSPSLSSSWSSLSSAPQCRFTSPSLACRSAGEGGDGWQ